jgi:hypothetical protein
MKKLSLILEEDNKILKDGKYKISAARKVLNAIFEDRRREHLKRTDKEAMAINKAVKECLKMSRGNNRGKKCLG